MTYSYNITYSGIVNKRIASQDIKTDLCNYILAILINFLMVFIFTYILNTISIFLKKLSYNYLALNTNTDNMISKI